MGELTFETTLQKRGPAAAVVLDDEQVAMLGEGKQRFPVTATINGFTFEHTVTKMRGEFLLGLNKATRTAAGAEAGDTVTVTVALHTAERVVDVPPALAEALDADPDAKARYDALAYSHRKEFARWIAEAKKDDTRERRVTQALELIRAGKTR